MYHYVFLLCTRARQMRSISTSLQEPLQWLVPVLVDCLFADPRPVHELAPPHPIWGLNPRGGRGVFDHFFSPRSLKKGMTVEQHPMDCQYFMSLHAMENKLVLT